MAGTPAPPIYDPAPRNSSSGQEGLLTRYGLTQAPGTPYQNIFQQNRSKYLGGFDPGDFLRAHGFTFNQGPSAGTTFNRGGQSYTNVGAGHEGGGAGGESRFLGAQGFTPSSSLSNLDPSMQYGGQIGMMDKAMASVAQGNLHDRAAQLTPQDKARLSASGKDIFGNSAFGVDTSHTVPGTTPHITPKPKPNPPDAAPPQNQPKYTLPAHEVKR